MPTYMKSIRNTLLQFLDFFNNIRVNKYAKDGTLIKTVTVPVKMANKEKSYIYSLDSRTSITTPMIAVELQGINYESDKTTGRDRKIVFNKNLKEGTYSYYYNPAPYQLDVAVHIIGKYVVEVDQILEQILSIFNPFVQTRVKISDYSDETIDVKIVFTGASPAFGPEYDESDYRLASWTLNFQISSFMFRPSVESPPELIKSIVNRVWFSSTEEKMKEIIENGNLSFDTPSTSGYTVSAVLSGLGYDESAKILFSYQLFER